MSAVDCGSQNADFPSFLPCMKPQGHPGDHWSTTGCAGGGATWPRSEPEPITPLVSAEQARAVVAAHQRHAFSNGVCVDKHGPIGEPTCPPYLTSATVVALYARLEAAERRQQRIDDILASRAMRAPQGTGELELINRIRRAALDGEGDQPGRQWRDDGCAASTLRDDLVTEQCPLDAGHRGPHTYPSDGEGNQCSGLTASWCPVHGDCRCPRGPVDGDFEHMSAPDCPLHSAKSQHTSGEGNHA